MVRIALTNLGKYNEGILVYGWLDLPFTDEEMDEVLSAIGIDDQVYEEYVISDYTTDIIGLEIDEYTNLYRLNDLIVEYEALHEHDQKKAQAAMEYFGYDLEEVLERLDNFALYEGVKTLEELGRYWAEVMDLFKGKEFFENYFDFERYGRDIDINSAGGFTSFGYIEEIS